MAFEPDLKNEIFPGTLYRSTSCIGVTHIDYDIGSIFRFKRFKTEWGRPEWWFDILTGNQKGLTVYFSKLEDIKTCLVEVSKDELAGILYAD